MPIYHHSWNVNQGWNREVFDDRDFIVDDPNVTENWEHPRKRRLGFLTFTCNESFYNWMDNAEPEHRVIRIKEFYPEFNSNDRISLVRMVRQQDECIPWTNKKEYNFYLGWYLNPIGRLILEEKLK